MAKEPTVLWTLPLLRTLFVPVHPLADTTRSPEGLVVAVGVITCRACTQMALAHDVGTAERRTLLVLRLTFARARRQAVLTACSPLKHPSAITPR